MDLLFQTHILAPVNPNTDWPQSKDNERDEEISSGPQKWKRDLWKFEQFGFKGDSTCCNYQAFNPP